MRDNILSSLNPVQQKAVVHDNGPLLVFAGAGSGKTRVLTHRIAYLIHHGVDPRHILAVTFTNKAAGEMKERVGRLLGPCNVDGILWIGTFHGICVKILKREIGRLAGYNERFTIYDEYDQQSLVKECLKSLNLDEKKYNPAGIVARLSRAKDDLIDERQYKELAYRYYEGQVSKVYDLYQAKLRQSNAVDFGDLIMLTVGIFRQFNMVIKGYQERFKYLLVDEYQDTNHAQYEFIKLISGAHKNIFIVGDPDQSIYGWRSADINNILNFEKDFRSASVIKLEQNYRSTQNIINAANSLIVKNSIRKHKALWTDNAEGEKVEHYFAEDGEEEARGIVSTIKELKSEGRKLGDIAIFYRLHAQSRLIEDALRLSGIPYIIVGGVRFYDRKEIKDVLGYLRVIDNQADTVNLKRIINVPRRGIGQSSLKMIEKHAKDNNITLFEALARVKDIQGLSPRVIKIILGFSALILKHIKLTGEILLSKLMKEILSDTYYLTVLLAEKTEESLERADNVRELVSAAVQFEKANSSAGLHAFLEEIALVSNVDMWENKSNAVTLMTLHSAKGLEFPVCFMVGMEEGIFPHFGRDGETMTELEEERRLCYVGMTRAKERLFFTSARRRMIYGRWGDAEMSRFVGEIEGEFLEEG